MSTWIRSDSSEVSFDSSEEFFLVHVDNIFSPREHFQIFTWRLDDYLLVSICVVSCWSAFLSVMGRANHLLSSCSGTHVPLSDSGRVLLSESMV